MGPSGLRLGFLVDTWADTSAFQGWLYLPHRKNSVAVSWLLADSPGLIHQLPCEQEGTALLSRPDFLPAPPVPLTHPGPSLLPGTLRYWLLTPPPPCPQRLRPAALNLKLPSRGNLSEFPAPLGPPRHTHLGCPGAFPDEGWSPHATGTPEAPSRSGLAHHRFSLRPCNRVAPVWPPSSGDSLEAQGPLRHHASRDPSSITPPGTLLQTGCRTLSCRHSNPTAGAMLFDSIHSGLPAATVR